MTFSNDRDILKYEPVLFSELYFHSQVLCSGSDWVVSGTTFTSSSADFSSANVKAGQVIYLHDGEAGFDGCFEIVSVDSATELTVSVLRAEEDSSAVSVGSGSGISWRISTFDPQAREAALSLSGHFGIGPGAVGSEYDVDDVAESGVLRQVSTFAVISGIYATLGCGSDGDEGLWKKSLYYQKQYEKHLERCRIGIDADSDGESDFNRGGSSYPLTRI